jgi:hypothetical protein
VVEVRTPLLCYSFRHSLSVWLHDWLALSLLRHTDAPLPCERILASEASARYFAPLDYRRITTRPVSCYALFQGWLLLSQPPGCLCTDTSFSTQYRFGGLSCRSGLFPFRQSTFAPTVSLRGQSLNAFGVCRRLVGGEAPAQQQCSTSFSVHSHGLHLNAFRGEPAISAFDWHFTPIHSSSEQFVTYTGAALHVLLRTLQPDHG